MSVVKTRRKWLLKATILVVVFNLSHLCLCSELQSLMKLKASLTQSNPEAFSTWDEKTPIANFAGIRSDPTGFVSEIDLSNKRLSGSLPFDAICALPSLRRLSLGSNSLHGTITEDLKNCTNLESLDLGNNSFTGKVPDLSSLKALKLLSLNACDFSGAFPWKSLSNLANLSFLSLGDNPFDASPFPEEILRLRNLNWLYLSNCSLLGKFPAGIGNLSLLQNLELADNGLSGEIPGGIMKLKSLQQLELYNNSLVGKLPVGFGNLTSLFKFDASMNFLGGDLTELRTLTNLGSLQLFQNEFVGEIPPEIGEFRNLYELSLYRNKLTGEIPPKIGSWQGLEYIDVSENSLTGEIPPGMCKNGKMTDLLVLQNKLSGAIPASYGDCTSLVRFLVNNNSLSGSVPEKIWGLPNLERLDLSMNQFEGRLSPEIGKSKALGQLVLSDNRFSGEIPGEISEASSLVLIQVSFNNFSGRIPATIGKLLKLSSLYLDNNQFSGEIPNSLGSCISVSQINLAHNSLSGQIPNSLGSLPNLNSLNLARNRLSGQIPSSMTSLTLSLLDLSNNLLTGRVPESPSIRAFKDNFGGNPGLCSDSMSGFQGCSRKPRNSGRFRTLMFCFVALTLALLMMLACFLVTKLRRNHCSSSLKAGSWNMKPYHILSFTEREIIEAIKPENLIGKGGSGHVYKVALKDREAVAVKHIWANLEPGNRGSFRSTTAMLKRSKQSSSEYDAEVATLSSIRHVNVVKLYCSITSEDSNLLVYEYLPNGSLWDRLHTCQKIEMGWLVRYEVAVGAAKGLEYLHHGCDRPVIHRDVKSSNILLDQNWKPRIADFGLARIVQANGDCTNVIAGTLGYIAPEYAYTCKVNEKSDVYSFGVVLMELVTGKRPVEPEFGESKDIVNYVHDRVKSGENVLDLIDPTVSDALREEALKVLKIAIHCTSHVPVLRPSMRMVVHMLEEAEPCKLTTISVNKEGEEF